MKISGETLKQGHLLSEDKGIMGHAFTFIAHTPRMYLVVLKAGLSPAIDSAHL